uniref:Serpentine receptor class gamma n=1 Tax=Panagrolaimus sp. PS1159 TaxID=55785 RepID=A0AC35EW05_9BILA
MCDRDLLKHSCYKLMVFMGFLDLHTSLYVGGVAGIFCIKGYVFCQWPTLWFWIGCLHGMAWKMQCSSVVLLAFNRCLEAFNPKWSNILFTGKRTLFWMILPVLWGLRDIVFGPPVYFSPIYMTLTYDPHVGYFSDTKNMYMDPTIFYNNIFLALAVPLIYAIFGVCLHLKTKNAVIATFEQQTKIFGQILMISALFSGITIAFVVVQFFPLPQSYNPWLQWIFLIFDGQPAIIYLAFNATLRRKVMILVCFRKKSQHSVTAPMVQLSINVF